MECIKETNKIYLNRRYLSINNDKIQVWKYTKEKGDRPIPVKDGKNVTPREGYRIKLKKYMYPKNIYKVKIEIVHTDISISIHDYGFLSKPYDSEINHPNAK